MKDLTEGIPSELSAWLAGLVAAAIGWVIRFVYTRTSDRIDELDRRVQEVERKNVEEHRVRQLILDAVVPIKESQEEIKHDLNRILDILLRHQTRDEERDHQWDKP